MIGSLMKLLTWPRGSLAFVAVDTALLAAPARLEGPTLVPISPGHALAVLDAIALVPLLVGLGWLEWDVWTRRKRLYETMCRMPGRSSLGVFVAGFGLGLVLASVFSSFFWWWAVGAVLIGAMLLAALVIVTRG